MPSDTVIIILKELQDYYDKKLTPAQVKTYVRLLSDIDITRLRQGADAWMQFSSWFPKVAELIIYSKKFAPLPQGNKPDMLHREYWYAMSTFNDVTQEMPPELEKYIR